MKKGTEAPSASDIGAELTVVLRRAVGRARALGCRNPKLFFESESAALFVMDGDDPRSNASRQEAVVLRVPVSEPFDVGAW